jgi:hypothetical protein
VLKVFVRRAAAWAPGLETPEAWGEWARRPRPIAGDGAPAAAFLPALLRRRCDRLTRMLLHAAHHACDAAERASARSVFASRHGCVVNTIELLAQLAADQELSPTRFSHSVHNAPAGLFSIAAGNRAASTSVAAGMDTFACGFLEAATQLARAPGSPVLLVAGEEPLPEVLQRFAEPGEAPHAVALLLAAQPPGRLVELAIEPGDGPPAAADWPPAVAFLRAFLAGDAEVRIGSGAACFRWRLGG